METKGVFETDTHILKYTANRAKNGRAPGKGGWAKRPGKPNVNNQNYSLPNKYPGHPTSSAVKKKKTETKPQPSK